MQQRQETEAEFVCRFRNLIACKIQRNRKELIRQQLDGDCLLLKPGTWKRAEDWMRETEEDQRKAERRPLVSC
jgi:hypothetical protein